MPSVLMFSHGQRGPVQPTSRRFHFVSTLVPMALIALCSSITTNGTFVGPSPPPEGEADEGRGGLSEFRYS